MNKEERVGLERRELGGHAGYVEERERRLGPSVPSGVRGEELPRRDVGFPNNRRMWDRIFLRGSNGYTNRKRGATLEGPEGEVDRQGLPDQNLTTKSKKPGNKKDPASSLAFKLQPRFGDSDWR